MKKHGLGFLTMILVVVTLFCTTGTVMGQGKEKLQIEDQYYHKMEQEYVNSIREILKEEGYENAGVTMTMKVNTDGEREYRVNIHHAKIDSMDTMKKEQLEMTLQKAKFAMNGSRITTNFIAYNC